MVMSRDRWPAVLTREQEDILMSAGFRYDPDPGVLVHPRLRKVLSVEAAAERGAKELRDFATTKKSTRRVEMVFDGEERARDFLDTVKRRYGWP